MRLLYIFVVFSIFTLSASKDSCKISSGGDIVHYSPDINTVCKSGDNCKSCTATVIEQINKEFEASLKYLNMAAFFSQDVINLPGFAKFFFDSASEEREHGIKLMKYLSLRGELAADANIIQFPTFDRHDWVNGLDALEDAIKLEVGVTESIKQLIKVCEDQPTGKETSGIGDYHISDWLTGEYLEEQYKSLRDLAGKISTLKNLKTSKGNTMKDLGEFIFDKKLMGIDI